MDNDFKIKRATVSYIYSFLPVAGDMTYDLNVLNALIDSKLPGSTENGRGKPYNTDIRTRFGLSSYLSLDIPMGYEYLEVIRAQVNNLDLKIFPLLRYFSHGCSLTFHVVADKINSAYFSAEEAYPLMHLVTTIENKSATVKLANGKTLYEYFIEIVNAKIQEANIHYFSFLLYNNDTKKPEKLYNAENTELFMKFLKNNNFFIPGFHNSTVKKFQKENQDYPISVIREKLLEELSQDLNLSNEDHFDISMFIYDNTISLLCLKEDLLNNANDIEKNMPLPLISFELADCDALSDFTEHYPGLPRKEASSQKLNKIRRYETELSHFLFRLVDEEYDSFKIEPSYDTFESNTRYNGYNNIYLDARLYIHASRRAIITITNDNSKKPASYLLPTLFGLCELVHTRWQALIALNLILDKYIREFSNHRADNYSPSVKLKIILNVTKRVLANLENPITYTVSGDTLREINELMAQTFKLEDLENNALRKCELLERIYELGLNIDILKS